MTFKKIKSVPYPNQRCFMDEYLHEESGLRHYHLNSSFPELVFALCLPTPPEDDTGMPHILEHFTLSGGHKYPLKDPFMAMNNRSVAHDMNAQTSRLNTTYYFATTLDQDYKNLSDVYLDLVFNPLLRQTDFEQEGWRLERDENNVWSLKGVVLNEMKGVYANPNSNLYDHILKSLSPNTPSARSSGGHPTTIPYLEYPRLLDFHRRYYTPQKAVLATSGDVDIEKLHQQVEEALTQHQLNALPPQDQPTAPPVGALQQSVYVERDGALFAEIPGDPNSAPFMIATYSKPTPVGPEQELWESLMFLALFNSATSPLNELQQKWQCSVDAQYFYESAHTSGNVGGLFIISGLDPKHVQSFHHDLTQLWETLAVNGVSQGDWEFAVAAITKSERKAYGKSVIDVVKSIAHSVVLNRDPLWDANNLEILNNLGVSIPKAEDIAAYCRAFAATANPIIVLENKDDLLARWDMMEEETVQKMVQSGRAPTNKVELEHTSVELLPCLNQNDVVFPNRTPSKVAHQPSTEDALAYTLVDAPDAPTVAFNLMYDVGGVELSLHEKMLLFLWSKTATDFGTARRTYEEQGIIEDKRGVNVRWNFTHDSNMDQKLGLTLALHVNSLVENVDDAVSCVVERSLGAPVFEESHWKVVLSGMLEATKKGLAENIVSQSRAKANAPYTEAFALQSELFDYLLEHRIPWLQKAVEQPQFAHQEFSAVLEKVLQCPKHVAGVGPLEHIEAMGGHLAKQCNGKKWEDLSQYTVVHTQVPDAGTSQRLPAALMINHCTRSFPGPKWNTKDAAAVKVALELVDNKLHEVVREYGGAYGVYSSLSNMTVTLTSYRDPNVEETFAAFNNVPQYLEEIINEKNSQRLNEAKLSLYKRFLVPQSSFAKAGTELDMLRLSHSREEEEKLMERLRDVDWSDVQRVTQKWLSPDPATVTDCAAVAQSKFVPPQKMK